MLAQPFVQQCMLIDCTHFSVAFSKKVKNKTTNIDGFVYKMIKRDGEKTLVLTIDYVIE